MHWLLTRVCCLVIHGWETRPWWMTLLAKQSINIKQTNTKLFIFSFSEFVRPHIFRLQIFSARVFMISPCWVSLLHLPRATGRGEYISRRGFYQQCSYTQKYKSTDKHPNTFSFPISKDATILWLSFSSWSSFCREPVQEGTAGMVCSQGFPRFSNVFQGFPWFLAENLLQQKSS